MAKTEVKENLGRVALFRSHDAQTYEELGGGGADVFEILNVQEIRQDTIIAGKYVLPRSDAKILNSESGLVYCYHVSLPYLNEISHLAEVEKNIVIGQAYLYKGHNIPNGKPNLFQWALVIFVFLMGVIAIMKG